MARATKRKAKRSPARKARPVIDLQTEPSIIAQQAKDHILVVYGPPGVGKSTFCNNLEDPSEVFFMSTDRGTRTIASNRQECNTWKDVEDVLAALEAGQSKNYSMIVLDHLDDLAMMAEDATCEELGIESLGDAGFAKGWRAYKKRIHTLFARLRVMDLGIVGICHEAIKTVRNRSIELERIMPDLSKSAWKVIVPLADVVIYCGFKSVKKAGKRVEVRSIQTEPTEDIYAKDRSNRRKPAGVELLDGAAFAATFTTPKTRRTKKKAARKRSTRR